jgi:hypothetical protein
MDLGQAVSHTYIEGTETGLKACLDGKMFRSVLRLVMDFWCMATNGGRTVRGGYEASEPKLTGAANGEGNMKPPRGSLRRN